MDDQETFTLLPLTIDPTTKEVSSTTPPSKALADQLKALYTLQRALLTLDTPGNVPPPPLPVNPKRGAQSTSNFYFSHFILFLLAPMIEARL
jgi:translocation protein SEC72